MGKWDIAVIGVAALGILYLLRETGKDVAGFFKEMSPSTQVKEVYNNVTEKIYDTKTMVSEKVSSVEKDFSQQYTNLITGDWQKAVEWGADKGKQILPNVFPTANFGIDFFNWAKDKLEGEKLNIGKDISYVPDSQGNPTNIHIREPGLTDIGTHKMLTDLEKPAFKVDDSFILDTRVPGIPSHYSPTIQPYLPWADPNLSAKDRWASKYSVVPEMDSNNRVSKVGVLKPEYISWEKSQPVVKGSGTPGYYSKG